MMSQRDRHELEEAIRIIEGLCAAARGNHKTCNTRTLEEAPLYLESWALPPLRRLLKKNTKVKP